MKTYIADIIPKIQRFSQKMDQLTVLQDQHWVLIDDLGVEKQVYLFRTGNELLISKNGKITRNKWEYLGNKSLIIDLGGEAFLFKVDFFDENLLALKIDSKDEYALFINENKYNGDVSSISKVIQFVRDRYLLAGTTMEVGGVGGTNIENDQLELSEDQIAEQELRRKEDANEMRLLSFVLTGAFILVLMMALWAAIRNGSPN